MNTSAIQLTTSKILLLQDSLDGINSQNSSFYSLRWKQGRLWVTVNSSDNNYLPALQNQAWIQRCLFHSKTKAVCINSILDLSELERWANICKKANKPLFIRSNTPFLHTKNRKTVSKIRRLINFLGSFLLILILSPIFLTIALLIYAESPGPIFRRQWSISQKGRVFQVLKFRVFRETSIHKDPNIKKCGIYNGRLTFIGFLIFKLRLDFLPQLINIFYGDMTFISSTVQALEECCRN